MCTLVMHNYADFIYYQSFFWLPQDYALSTPCKVFTQIVSGLSLMLMVNITLRYLHIYVSSILMLNALLFVRTVSN